MAKYKKTGNIFLAQWLTLLIILFVIIVKENFAKTVQNRQEWGCWGRKTP